MQEISQTEALNHILEVSDTTAADLVGMIGSGVVVSEILEGKRLLVRNKRKFLGLASKCHPLYLSSRLPPSLLICLN